MVGHGMAGAPERHAHAWNSRTSEIGNELGHHSGQAEQMASVVRELVTLVEGAARNSTANTPAPKRQNAVRTTVPTHTPAKKTAHAARQIPLDGSEERQDFSDFSRAA